MTNVNRDLLIAALTRRENPATVTEIQRIAKAARPERILQTPLEHCHRYEQRKTPLMLACENPSIQEEVISYLIEEWPESVAMTKDDPLLDNEDEWDEDVDEDVDEDYWHANDPLCRAIFYELPFPLIRKLFEAHPDAYRQLSDSEIWVPFTVAVLRYPHEHPPFNYWPQLFCLDTIEMFVNRHPRYLLRSLGSGKIYTTILEIPNDRIRFLGNENSDKRLGRFFMSMVDTHARVNAVEELPMHKAAHYVFNPIALNCLKQRHPNAFTLRDDNGKLPLEIACACPKKYSNGVVIEFFLENTPRELWDPKKIMGILLAGQYLNHGGITLVLQKFPFLAKEVFAVGSWQSPAQDRPRPPALHTPLHRLCYDTDRIFFDGATEAIFAAIEAYPEGLFLKSRDTGHLPYEDIPSYFTFKKEKIELVASKVVGKMKEILSQTYQDIDTTFRLPPDVFRKVLDFLF